MANQQELFPKHLIPVSRDEAAKGVTVQTITTGSRAFAVLGLGTRQMFLTPNEARQVAGALDSVANEVESTEARYVG
jgi:hypothetical protein